MNQEIFCGLWWMDGRDGWQIKHLSFCLSVVSDRSGLVGLSD